MEDNGLPMTSWKNSYCMFPQHACFTQVSLAASLSETHRTDKNLTRIGQHEKRNSNSASSLSFCKPNYEEIAQFVLQKRGKCGAGKYSCSVKLALLLSILVWNASCRAQIMSTTPQKIYPSLGDKYCRLCGSEKDVDRSTNVFSKIGIRKTLRKPYQSCYKRVYYRGSHIP